MIDVSQGLRMSYLCRTGEKIVSLQCHSAVTELLQGEKQCYMQHSKKGIASVPALPRGVTTMWDVRQCHSNETSSTTFLPNEPQNAPPLVLFCLQASFNLKIGFHPC